MITSNSFEKITKAHFDQYSNENNIIISNNGARSYGELTLYKEKKYVSWQSDLIEPILLIKENSIAIIGVDSQCVVVDINTGMILFKLGFADFLTDIKKFQEIFVIQTEYSVYGINYKSYDIAFKRDAEEVIDDVYVENGKQILKCIDGEEYSFNWFWR